jgi:phosphoenolpyruvate-protein phosphotransferase/dihydroxyacetone kinase phosphotransfer subunit
VVGIVVVSHSYRLAEGVAELAREMGGADVALETAGGLAMDGHPLGTDAVLVMEAVERAWSDDGVLVLMDLGSAVLSAEMALDLLPEERRAKILLCEAPLVEGAVAAAVAAKLGRPLAEVAEEARSGLAGKAAHLGTEVAPSAPAGIESEPPGQGPARSLVVTVGNAHGLHARPAARFVQTAASFDAEVTVANRTTGRGPVGARSLNAVATLGVLQGHEIEVFARGAEAERAIEAIGALAGRAFDEQPQDLSDVPLQPAEGIPPSINEGGALRGLAASPGAALGAAKRLRAPELAIPSDPAPEPDRELESFDRGLAATREDIQLQRAAAAARANAYEASIFDAHLLFLSDPALVEPTRAAIGSGARSAAHAWHDAVEEVARGWGALDDPYLRARVEDLRSVGRQVLARILGVTLPRPTFDAPGILVGPDLAPADAAGLDPAVVLGIATAYGAPTSHAALLARSIGIPAVVGVGKDLLAVTDGTRIGIDGTVGLVYLDPSPSIAKDLGDARAERDRALVDAKRSARSPASTVDGHKVEVAANIGRPEEVPAAVDAGADGVGLFRTEFLFLERGVASEEDQEQAYRRAAESLRGRPMIVRTLDAGADKPVPGLEQPGERNPFLGMRGLRLGLAMPEVLETQLRALLRVAADHPLRVMFPMVSTLEELRAGKAAVARAREALGSDAAMPVGVMIEVPAAALTASTLAQEADFFSIGTNDLTQYTLAAERGNEHVAGLADAMHPAVLRLIRTTAEAATAAGRWTGVCGELAADPEAAALLIGLGVDELSMSSPSIPLVKQAVRRASLRESRELARRALDLPSAAAVRALLASGT